MIEKMQIVWHEQIAYKTFICVLEGNLTKEIKNPGQFLQIKVKDKFLRRPISIADFDKASGKITIIYKIVGEGTTILSTYKRGETLDCLGPLGNGFNVHACKTADNIVLTGGGIGVPPLYGLAKTLVATYPEKKIRMVAGFQTKAAMFFESEFKQLCQTIYITDDGSYNGRGRYTVEELKTFEQIGYLFACGPLGMLVSIERQFTTIDMQLSYEERMACGIGICMGCVFPTDDKGGYIRVCKEGPVLTKEGERDDTISG